jgi:hypothetical protein
MKILPTTEFLETRRHGVSFHLLKLKSSVIKYRNVPESVVNDIDQAKNGLLAMNYIHNWPREEVEAVSAHISALEASTEKVTMFCMRENTLLKQRHPSRT